MTIDSSEIAGVETKRCPYPFPANDLDRLASTYAGLRANEPISVVTLPSGDTAYLVTRYADAQLVLSDRRFSTNLNRPEAARLREGEDGNLNLPYADDPAWHLRWRKLLAREFVPQRMAAVRGRIGEIANELADDMARRKPPVDLLETFAFALPARAICDFLGIPAIEQRQVREWIDIVTTTGEDDAGKRTAAGIAMRDYALALAETKRKQPGEDLITGLVAVRDDTEDDRLNEDELILTIMALIVGNNCNTGRQIGQGMFMLLSSPGYLDALRTDRALLPAAVEELLRATPLYTPLGRFATEEVKIGDVVIPRHATVLVARESANRDSAWISDPERFDIQRTDASRHLAFGYGPAFCIGAAFGRLQMECAFEALLDRFPRLRLAVPAEEITWTYRLVGSGPDAVPVAW
ncbi:cytochrome P450 [Saccharopolyspora sp. ASAGF58]|nr:cytochrome P450 [Saccharopolyspora sp. ASAGF58]